MTPFAWLLIGFAALTTHADPDLYGHTQFGLDILRDRGLTAVDPYSFTQDIPWTNHEWLSELAMGIAYTAGGGTGLIVLKAAIVFGVFMLIWTPLRQVADRWRWAALAVAIFSVLPVTATVRPQVWTLLLLAALCRMLTAGGRWQWGIPLLFVPWANFHGGWIVGLGVLGAWSVARGLAADAAERRRLAAVVTLSVGATLVTPYGLELWQFIASTVRMSRPDITEWQPTWHNTAGLVLWSLTVAFTAFVWRTAGRPPLPTLAVLLMLGFASIRVVRLVPLFAPVAVMLLAAGLPRKTTAVRRPRPQLVLETVMVMVALVFAVQLRAIPACIAVQGEWGPDRIALQSLIEGRRAGRMVTFFDWGQAALWHLGPDLKVSVDGRRETVYSQRTLEEQYAIVDGLENGFAALARLRPDYVWLPLPRSQATAEWLEQNGYRIDVRTEESFVAVRNDVPVLATAAVPAERCYAAPRERAALDGGTGSPFSVSR